MMEISGAPDECGSGVEETTGRKFCWNGCERPLRSCICLHLPPEPIPTKTHILILQHPHELRQKLSSVPALTKCLRNCNILPGRRLRAGSSPLLDSLYKNDESANSSRILFLFPSIGPTSAAVPDLAQWAKAHPGERALLIVFDGTWNHAREMVAASLSFLSGFAQQVSLRGGIDVEAEGDSTFESDLVLRKEPFRGCMSTLEAVARSLRILEPEGPGFEVEARLLSVLRAMTGFQSCHLKPTQPRVRLRRKKKGQQIEEQSGLSS